MVSVAPDRFDTEMEQLAPTVPSKVKAANPIALTNGQFSYILQITDLPLLHQEATHFSVRNSL